MDETEMLHRLRDEIQSLEGRALDKQLPDEQVETIKSRLAVLRSLVSQMETKDGMSLINDEVNNAIEDWLGRRS